jgi:hypothetical protein
LVKNKGTEGKKVSKVEIEIKWGEKKKADARNKGEESCPGPGGKYIQQTVLS